MIITIDLESSRPLYVQISDGIVRAIATGEVAPGERLPPGRELAASLDVNLDTVQRAYRNLIANGIANARVGRGTRIAEDIDPEVLGIARAVDALVEAARSIGMPVERLVSVIEQRFAQAR